MNEEIAIKICEQMKDDIDNLCDCCRKDEKNRTCIGCRELAIETILKENERLKDKLTEIKKQIEASNELVTQDTLTEMKLCDKVNRLRKEYQDTYKDVRIEIKEYKTQQKEFIKWLDEKIEKIKNTEFLDERIQNAGLVAYNAALQKYKELIGDKE